MSVGGTDDRDYAERLAAETERFNRDVHVHDLPEIFHYWSNRYLRPLLEEIGVSNPDQFFAKYLARSAAELGIREPRFLSLGAGNCDTEVRVAKLLRQAGLQQFEIHCFDISTEMLARGRELAAAEGVAEHIRTVEADVNRWQPDVRYAGIMANQSLHHMVELELLFDKVRDMLAEGGLFVVSDMIGRNGHQRWPEALELLKPFWAELPSSYRYNLQLQRQENEFLDWDCSSEGFEGIRSQDILPLLLQRFRFNVSVAFGNIIDPFIDRSFGHHFDANSPIDRQRIDAIHTADETAIRTGEITPTHLMAVMSAQGVAQPHLAYGLEPATAVRGTAGAAKLPPPALRNRLRRIARRLRRRSAQLSQQHLPAPVHRLLVSIWQESRLLALTLRKRLAARATAQSGSVLPPAHATTAAVGTESEKQVDVLPPRLDAALPVRLHRHTSHAEHQHSEAERSARREEELKLSVSLAAARTPALAGHCRLCAAAVEFVQHDFAADSAHGPDWREGLECSGCGMISRERACLLLALEGFDPAGQIYISEQLTPAFAWLHRRGYSVIGSEYLSRSSAAGSLAGHLRALTDDPHCALRHEDITRLQFNARRFDRVISMEVLEHVPDYPAALAEFFRVLAPGGRLVLTVPFATDLEVTRVRTEMSADGRVTHHHPPDYHVEPNNTDGSVCFNNFGWDLLDAMRKAGFVDCAYVEPWDPAGGLLHGCGVLIANKV